MLGTAGDVPLPRGFLGGGVWGSPGLRSPSLSPAPLFRPPFPRESSVLLTVWELLSCGTCIPGPAAGQEPVFAGVAFRVDARFSGPGGWKPRSGIQAWLLVSISFLACGRHLVTAGWGGGEEKGGGGGGGRYRQREREHVALVFLSLF